MDLKMPLGSESFFASVAFDCKRPPVVSTEKQRMPGRNRRRQTRQPESAAVKLENNQGMLSSILLTFWGTADSVMTLPS